MEGPFIRRTLTTGKNICLSLSLHTRATPNNVLPKFELLEEADWTAAQEGTEKMIEVSKWGNHLISVEEKLRGERFKPAFMVGWLRKAPTAREQFKVSCVANAEEDARYDTLRNVWLIFCK